jgi:uncharacterized protein (TIGR02588 family)
MTTDEEKEPERNNPFVTTPIAEWIIALLGGVLIAASFGFLFYRAIREKEPPSFDFHIETMERAGDQHAVKVLVRNIGGRPVANLRIRVARVGIAINDEKCRQHTTVLDYVPAHSARHATFVFDHAIAPADLRFTVDSFTDP